MPAAVEHPKTAQTNFRLDPETKKRGDEALALAGYTPSEAARSLWEVAASGRYRPELIHAFLSGTIAIEYDSSVRKSLLSPQRKPRLVCGSCTLGGTENRISLRNSALATK